MARPSASWGWARLIRHGCKRTFSPETNYRFLQQPGFAVATSSLFYLVPAFTCFYFDRIMMEASLWVAVALCSFLADVIHAGRRSWWHVADRVMSKTAMFSILIVKPFLWSPRSLMYTLVAEAACVISLLVPGLRCLGAAQRATSYHVWERNHLQWHALSVASGVAFNALLMMK